MSCSPQILHRRSGHVARNIYRTRDYTRSNREFLITSFLVELTTNVVIVSVVLVLVPGNGMSSNLYNAGVREKKYGGETHVRQKKEKKTKKKRHYLPRNRSRRLSFRVLHLSFCERKREYIYVVNRYITKILRRSAIPLSFTGVFTHTCAPATRTHTRT